MQPDRCAVAARGCVACAIGFLLACVFTPTVAGAADPAPAQGVPFYIAWVDATAHAVKVIDSTGADVAAIPVSGPSFGIPAISADGKTLVYVSGTNGWDYWIWKVDLRTSEASPLLAAPWCGTLRWLPGSSTQFIYRVDPGVFYLYDMSTQAAVLWQDRDTLAPFGVNSYRYNLDWDDAFSTFILRAGIWGTAGESVFAGDYCSDDPAHHICNLRRVSPPGSSSWSGTIYHTGEITSDGGRILYWKSDPQAAQNYLIQQDAITGEESLLFAYSYPNGNMNMHIIGNNTVVFSATAPSAPGTVLKSCMIEPFSCQDIYAWPSNPYPPFLAIVPRPALGPRADAGPDGSAEEGAPVALDGTASSGDDLRFQWEQVAGAPVVAIADATGAATSFEAPYVGANTTLTFQLTVTDARGQTDVDTVDVTVVSVNDPPIADAGDDFAIKEGAVARLSASDSYDPNNDTPLYYLWRQVAGASVTLDAPASPSPSFSVPPVAGTTLAFEVIVSDGREASVPDTVEVYVVVNATPVANAGDDQTKNEGGVVSLNGLKSSDADGDGLSYVWEQVVGRAVALSSSSSATPSFLAPFVSQGGESLVFQLVVIDDDAVNPLQSPPDLVTVTVVNVNDPPRCDLGRSSVAVLWPPNHTMESVTIEGVVDPDAAQDVTVTLRGVTQDEPVEGLGDGDASPDAVISATGTSTLLRAERAGGGNGRVYEITFSASDGQESCTGSVAVAIPHDRKAAAVDDGQLYDSTEP